MTLILGAENMDASRLIKMAINERFKSKLTLSDYYSAVIFYVYFVYNKLYIYVYYGILFNLKFY